MATTGDTCPLCREPGLKVHCTSPTCSWHKCTACKITLDLDGHRGLTRDHKAIRLG